MNLTVGSVPQMYSEMMIWMKMSGVVENSRNGRVLSLPRPILVSLQRPNYRVLADPIRDANPFFHLMEFVWMMAGERDVEWLAQFNKKMYEFAENDFYIHGAYGYRWIHHFQVNQITDVVKMLREDPTTRRAVMAMWDPDFDLGQTYRDLPCNTHIYFRVFNGALDMTVCNRSNDVIWGMTGANAVHMTLLHEFIASAIGMPLGWYRVFTNNAHIYLDLPRVEQMLETRYPVHPRHGPGNFHPMPVLAIGDSLHTFLDECRAFIKGRDDFTCTWLQRIALPAHRLWFNREEESEIADYSWRAVCDDWLQRRLNKVK